MRVPELLFVRVGYELVARLFQKEKMGLECGGNPNSGDFDLEPLFAQPKSEINCSPQSTKDGMLVTAGGLGVELHVSLEALFGGLPPPALHACLGGLDSRVWTPFSGYHYRKKNPRARWPWKSAVPDSTERVPHFWAWLS